MTEPMKTAEEFFKSESEKQWLNSRSFSADPGSIARIPYVVHPAIFKVMDEYAAQQVAAERERIKMYMKGRLDKCESEIKDTSVDSDARRLLQGHKYELSHLLKEIDSL